MHRNIVDKLVEVLHNEDLTLSECEEVARMFTDRVTEEVKSFERDCGFERT